MSELPKSYDPKLVEEKWYSFWEKGDFFKANPKSGKKPYCIVIPPPNVTGVLHMGHALVDTLEDILIRWKRMDGYEALWVPGTDHAGIATQTVVERHLYAKTGKRRKDFTREEFLDHIWQWKKQSEERIIHQIKKLGCSCDWSRLHFTMDPSLTQAVRTSFKKMYDEGLIYRGNYLVNWDPALQTALSDDEVEFEEKDHFLWHIRYPLADHSGSLVVATTRPETMLGDTGVAVHPSDLRYKQFVGKEISFPLADRKIPIIADHFVDPTFGTGAVKLTPAHDFNDFEAAQRHNLPLLNILTPDAHLNENGGEFAGLSVEEARIRVVEKLKQMGFLVKVEPHKMRVGHSYRSKAVVQPYLSKQWFLKMGQFKEKLISAVKDKRVKLIPPHWEQTYYHWIENLRDWCISRQIWWGHRIPIWYDPENPDKLICYDGEGVPPHHEHFIQDPDVLDTWFSSALWPFSVLGWPQSTKELETFYPTSTLITGHDILFFWVARMILMGEYFIGKVPFHETFLHGLIYGKSYWRMDANAHLSYVSTDEKKEFDLGKPLPKDVHSKWEKMSKSKGNVIDPLEIIDTYGTDALRMALTSSVTHARQIDLDLRKFEEFKNFANKIWNGARFIFMNIEDLHIDELIKGIHKHLLTLEDHWIFSVLNRTIGEIVDSLTNYHFDRAAQRSYEFFWNDFCAIYLELSKPVLFGKMGTPEERKNKQKILTVVLSNAIRLMHPIAPFITEEIFSILKEKFPLSSHIYEKYADAYTQETIQAFLSPVCMKAPYPSSIEAPNLEIEKTFLNINEIVKAIRNIRGEMQIPPQEKTDLIICGNWIDLKKHEAILYALTPTKSIQWETESVDTFGSSTIIQDLKLTIPIPASLKLKERARLEKELEKAEKMQSGTKEKLSNQEFCNKAPKEIVEKLENTFKQTERSIEEILQKINQL